MTILHLIDSLYRGGAQKVVIDIIKLFPEHKHYIGTFENFSGLENEIEDLQNVSIIKLPFKNFASILKCIFFLREFITREDVKIVHAHMFVPNLLSRLLQKNVKKFSTYHGEVFAYPNPKKRIFIFLEKILFSKSTENIFVSSHVKSYVLNNLRKCDQGRIIYNYAESTKHIKQYKINKNKEIKMVATSNNQPYKNYPLLINALEHLKNEPIHLYIYGDLMDPLKKMVKEKNIENKISFMGVHKNIPAVIPEYDVFVMVSDSGEGFSLSLLEAMNSGIGIICSDIPQFLEAVGEDYTLRFKNRDLNDLRRTINKIINNPELLEDQGRLLKDRAKKFSKENFHNQIKDLYYSII